ncbi:hypothetical protein [Oceanobacillus sp. 1P07AA]|uniref:hypothetical protein n=1 Tax=Oceanobacillus sp. 1P07AA TaxID=3132293 RepID=UPI0039A427E6
MSILLYFITPFIIATIIHFIMHEKYKHTEKVDKGFVLIYHKLTYRRKMFRSLWNIPIFILVYIGVYWVTDLTPTEYTVLGVMFILLCLLDFLYNIVKWRKHEKGQVFKRKERK